MSKHKTRYESISVEIEGKTYTADISIHDVGNHKEMFDLVYEDVFHHDTSVFNRNSESIAIFAKMTLRQIIEGTYPGH